MKLRSERHKKKQAGSLRTDTMVMFWFICALMIVMALWFVLPALWQTRDDAKTDDARTANLLVYQDQLREMANDLKAGLLSEAQYEQDKEELQRRMLEDVGDSKIQIGFASITQSQTCLCDSARNSDRRSCLLFCSWQPESRRSERC